MTTPNKSPCYCKNGQTACGKCQICGKPGHTRHFPGPVPYTSSWCDEHYDMLAAEFRAGGSRAPAHHFRIDADADDVEPQCIYVACHGDWAISLVVKKTASSERYDRDATFDMPDFFSIWFVPVSAWTGKLKPIPPEEYASAYDLATDGANIDAIEGESGGGGRVEID